MQQTNFIKMSKIEEVKRYMQSFCESKRTVWVEIRKTRTKGELYEVIVEGVYHKFCTVKDEKMKLSFTIQYVDIITGGVIIHTEKQEDQ